MSPAETIADYLLAAEDVADALDALLDEIDPDGEEYGDAIAALYRFRRRGLELCGQTSLPLTDATQTTIQEAA